MRWLSGDFLTKHLGERYFLRNMIDGQIKKVYLYRMTRQKCLDKMTLTTYFKKREGGGEEEEKRNIFSYKRKISRQKVT